MKKMALGISLALAFGLFVSPAMAADPAQAPRTLNAADQAFFASLAKQVGTPDPVPAAKRPREIGQKALCSATAYCWDGSTRYCESNTSATSCSAVDSNCPGTQGHVTCNGQTQACPPCPGGGCGPDFCTGDDEYNCGLSCGGCPYTFSCNYTYCFERCKCNWSICPV